VNVTFKTLGIWGLVTLFIGVALSFVYPLPTASLPAGFHSPVLAFEFAHSTEDVYQIFGQEANAQQAGIRYKMDLGNTIDFLFMVVYSSFLMFFFRLASRDRKRRLFYVGVFFAFIALVSDIYENIQLFQISAKLNKVPFENELLLLHYSTWTKWGSLAISFLIARFYLVKEDNLYARCLAVSASIPWMLVVLAYIHPHIWAELMALSIMFMFVGLTVFCFRKRPSPKTPQQMQPKQEKLSLPDVLVHR